MKDDWASGALHLFEPNFLKEVIDYLQQLQFLRKSRKSQVFSRPPAQLADGTKQAMASIPLFPLEWSVQQTSASWKKSFHQEMISTNSNSVYTQCGQFFTTNTCCQSYVGQSKGHGVHVATSVKGSFNGSRQSGHIYQHFGGVNSRQLGFTDCQKTCIFL